MNIDSSGGEDMEGLPTFADWFTSLPGREIFAKVPIAFFEDDFNLFEVHGMPHFDRFLDIVLTDEPPEDELLGDSAMLTGLFRFYEIVHQRYITTRAGLHEMYNKFIRGEFGKCPRTLCNGEFVLPLGPSSQPGKASLKLYCPNCQDLYVPPSRRQAKLDGVGFGPSFAHLLILCYRERLTPRNDWSVYIPKIFGFKVSPTSSMSQKMSWIRRVPDGYR